MSSNLAALGNVALQDIQQTLVNLGFDLGNFGPNKNGVDGDWGDMSINAAKLAQIQLLGISEAQADGNLTLDQFNVLKGIALKNYENAAQTVQQATSSSEPTYKETATPPATTDNDIAVLNRTQKQVIQARLTRLGFDTKGVDGVFGPNSNRAIARWKEANGLTAGPLTYGDLKELERQIEAQPKIEKTSPQFETAAGTIEAPNIVIPKTGVTVTNDPDVYTTIDSEAPKIPVPKAKPENIPAQQTPDFQDNNTSWIPTTGNYKPSDTATAIANGEKSEFEANDPRPGTLEIINAKIRAEYKAKVASGEIEPQEPQKGRKRLTTRKKISDPSLPSEPAQPNQPQEAYPEAPSMAPPPPVKLPNPAP